MTGPPDPDGRRFFRGFAGDVVRSAAQVVGVVGELQARSAAEAGELLRDPAPVPNAAVGAGLPPVGSDGHALAAAPRGFRTPFRFESDDVLLLIDQRRLPDVLVEVPIRTAGDAGAAIRDMIVRGAPAIGQVAAIGLALQARAARAAPPRPRQAVLQGAATTLRNPRP